jgi:beta-glucosidase
LVAFQRVALAAGEQRELTFTVPADLLALVDDAGRPQFAPGRLRLIAGGCSPGPRGLALGAAAPATADLAVAP